MATVKFYLKRPKSAGKLRRQEVTICARFTLSAKERIQIKTEERIEPRFWDSKAQCVKSNAPGHVSANLYLQEFKRDLLTLYRDNFRISFQEFSELAKRKSGPRKSIWDLIDQYRAMMKQDRDAKTLARLDALIGHLKAFQEVKAFGLESMNWSFNDSFRAYLYGNGLSDSTVYRYISDIKTMLRWAEKRGFSVGTIYKEWSVVKRVATPISLTLDELERLESAILPPEADYGRDFLVLECRTGQRISDLMRFDVRDYEAGKWTFNRKKGNSIKARTVTVHFVGYCAPALMILGKHNFNLPKYTEQAINRSIKLACEKAGIDSEVRIERWQGGTCTVETKKKFEIVTTHTGRKTFITLALQCMPPKIVKDLAGIDSYQTLKHYEGESEAAIIRAHLESMEQKLKAS